MNNFSTRLRNLNSNEIARIVTMPNPSDMVTAELALFLDFWLNPPDLGPYFRALKSKTSRPGRRKPIAEEPCFTEIVQDISPKSLRTIERRMRTAEDRVSLPKPRVTTLPNYQVAGERIKAAKRPIYPIFTAIAAKIPGTIAVTSGQLARAYSLPCLEPAEKTVVASSQSVLERLPRIKLTS